MWFLIIHYLLTAALTCVTVPAAPSILTTRLGLIIQQTPRGTSDSEWIVTIPLVEVVLTVQGNVSPLSDQYTFTVEAVDVLVGVNVTSAER